MFLRKFSVCKWKYYTFCFLFAAVVQVCNTSSFKWASTVTTTEAFCCAQSWTLRSCQSKFYHTKDTTRPSDYFEHLLLDRFKKLLKHKKKKIIITMDLSFSVIKTYRQRCVRLCKLLLVVAGVSEVVLLVEYYK